MRAAGARSSARRTGDRELDCRDRLRYRRHAHISATSLGDQRDRHDSDPSQAATTQSATPAPGTSTAPATPATKPRRSSGEAISNAALAAAIVAALAILCCLAWGVARMTSFEPRWLQSLRHSLAEASYRTSATLAEFGDWMRLGR